MSGSHWIRSLATTVATPAKKCGRKASSRPTVAGPPARCGWQSLPDTWFRPTVPMTTRPSALQARQDRRTRCADRLLRSSFGANCVGLTKIETMTRSARAAPSSPVKNGRHAVRPWSAPARLCGAARAILNRAAQIRQCAYDAQVTVGFSGFHLRSVAARAHRCVFGGARAVND